MAGLVPNWGSSAPTSFDGGAGVINSWGLGSPMLTDPMTSAMSLPGGVAGSMPTITGMGGVGGMGQSGFGLNIPTAGLALGGLQTIGSLWAAFQQAKLAKQQFKYTKSVTNTNLANQIKTYNTGLTDRANNRAIVEGRTPEQTQSYIDMNKLSKFGS